MRVLLLQERLNSSTWMDVEHVGYYLNEGFMTADYLRMSAITNVGVTYAATMDAVQVCCHSHAWNRLGYPTNAAFKSVVVP